MMVMVALLVLVASWLGRAVDASIPRSSHSHFALTDDGPHRPSRPAWNPSPKINPQGYLCDLYRRIPGEWEENCRRRRPYMGNSDTSDDDLDVPVMIRQVPGDGDCLFHAVAISLSLIQGGIHSRMDSTESLWELKDTSRMLRQMAVECLRGQPSIPPQLLACSTGGPDDNEKKKKGLLPRRFIKNRAGKQRARRYKQLFVQGCESMATTELLSTAAAQYGISGEEYCHLMEQDSYWGGGPEIVALCNILKRPIHVYELVIAGDDMRTDDDAKRSLHCHVRVPSYLMNDEFCLRRMATFGSPKYDARAPLHILSADSRFPDVEPHCITENGNHFMALFPVNAMRRWAKATDNIESAKFISDKKRRRVRGGAASDAESGDDASALLEDSNESWLLHGEWYNDLTYSEHPGSPNWLDLYQSSSKCGWHRKIFRSVKSDRLRKGRKQVAANHRLSMKRIVGFWISVFVWTVSHFHVGLTR